VDIDGTEIVDDGGDAMTVPALQQRIDHRGLAGPQKAGDQQDREGHAGASPRIGRPGRASTASTPPAITGTPLTSSSWMPFAGRFMFWKVACSPIASGSKTTTSASQPAWSRALRRMAGAQPSITRQGIRVHFSMASISPASGRSRTYWRKKRVKVPEERGC